jgi:hypothetical protein
MSRFADGERARRMKAAREVFIAIVERALASPTLPQHDYGIVFAYVCGALDVDDATFKRWQDSMRGRSAS